VKALIALGLALFGILSPAAAAPPKVPEMSPVWSPDGKNVAFIHYGDGRFEVHVAGADGLHDKMVAHSSFGDDEIAWSPTSKQLAGAFGNVYVSKPDGKSFRYITAFQTTRDPESWPSHPVFSPNGRQIAFNGPDDEGKVYLWPSGGTYDVLASGSNPSWSPDGKQIVLNDAGKITVVDVLTRTVRVIATAGRSAMPFWSPNGTDIAFTDVNLDRISDVYLVPAAGGTPMNITVDTPGPEVFASWSPRGRELLVVSYRDGAESIYRLGLDGHVVRRVANTTAYMNLLLAGQYATWSRQGTRIAFAGGPSCRGIFVVNKDGTHRHAVRSAC
jgi:Tol biopolymer transport system component